MQRSTSQTINCVALMRHQESNMKKKEVESKDHWEIKYSNKDSSNTPENAFSPKRPNERPKTYKPVNSCDH
jgi:hypothetical protein